MLQESGGHRINHLAKEGDSMHFSTWRGRGGIPQHGAYLFTKI